MAILSDCTSCKVVDQVATISHEPPAGWASFLLDFELFKATYEVRCLDKLWPAKSHVGPQRALDLRRLWWINLRASGVAFVKHGQGGECLKYVWPFFPPPTAYNFQCTLATHWHFQMFKCSFFFIMETDGLATLTPPPLELPLPAPKCTQPNIEFFLLPPRKLNI